MTNPEIAKYQKLWAGEDYRKFSPGEQLAMQFVHQSGVKPDDVVIDFGCGSGRGSIMVAAFGKAKMIMLDFTDNCLDDFVKEALVSQKDRLSFVQADLEKDIPVAAKYGYCTDVMEHIPPEKVDTVLKNIMKAAQHVFFAISCMPDDFGATIGEELHLTVRPFAWWLEKFKQLDAVVHWSNDQEHTALFYVTAWGTGTQVVEAGVLNTSDEQLKDHIKSSVARGLQECMPYGKQNIEVMLLGGGPSLEEHADEIVERWKEGTKVITTNGAYNWAINKGIVPSAQVVVDAREFNTRFVNPIIPTCKYLIASQCPPVLFDAIPKEQTYLWHSVDYKNKDLAPFFNELYAGRPWFSVPGGSTVMLRSFILLRTLGFCKFIVYGFDSCLDTKGNHHSYSQPENDKGIVVKVILNHGDRVFYAHPWMVSQAQEFMDQIRVMGDEIEMIVKGDGLIAYILKTGASLEDLEVVAPPS